MDRRLEDQCDEIVELPPRRGAIKRILDYLARNIIPTHNQQVTSNHLKPADSLRGLRPYTGFSKDDTVFLSKLHEEDKYGDSGVA
jgi:hypothetical protein